MGSQWTIVSKATAAEAGVKADGSNNATSGINAVGRRKQTPVSVGAVINDFMWHAQFLVVCKLLPDHNRSSRIGLQDDLG